MKHCPHCRVDFADKFEQCFQCGEELQEGALELEQTEVADESGARETLERAKVLSVVFLSLVLMILLGYTFLDPSLKVFSQRVLLHQESEEQSLLVSAGALRSAEQCKDLARMSGLKLPAPPKGRMLIYFPITSKKTVPTYKPIIEEVFVNDGEIVARIARSKEKVSAMQRVLGSAVDSIFGNRERPALQFVLTAEVEARDGPLRFSVPKNLGILEDEQTVDIALDYSEELTTSWTKSFLLYGLSGVIALFLFSILLLKLA